MKKRKLPEVHMYITKSIVCADNTKKKLKEKWIRLPDEYCPCANKIHTYVPISTIQDEHACVKRTEE